MRHWFGRTVLLFLVFIAIVIGQNFTPFRHTFDDGLIPNFLIDDAENPDTPTPSSGVNLKPNYQFQLGLNSSVKTYDLMEEMGLAQKELEKRLTVNDETWEFSMLKGNSGQLRYSGVIHLRCDMDYVEKKFNMELWKKNNRGLSIQKDFNKDQSSLQWEMKF